MIDQETFERIKAQVDAEVVLRGVSRGRRQKMLKQALRDYERQIATEQWSVPAPGMQTGIDPRARRSGYSTSDPTMRTALHRRDCKRDECGTCGKSKVASRRIVTNAILNDLGMNGAGDGR